MSRGREREDYGPASAGVRNKVSVLVRNIPLSYTAEDLRAKFEKYGELRDVYIPRDYYTQRSRGFGFIEFRDARDADEAIFHCDKTMLDGREINVCLSKEGRKTPREMMILETKQTGSGGSDDRRDRRRSRSPRRGSRYSRSRSPRGRSSRYSRSPRGRGGRDYDRDRDRDYDRGRTHDRERDRHYDREYDRGYDRDGRGGSDRGYDRDGRGGGDRGYDRDDRDGRGGSDRGRERERDREPEREYERERSRSRSPVRDRDPSPRGRDASPGDERPAEVRDEAAREFAPLDDSAQPVNDYY